MLKRTYHVTAKDAPVAKRLKRMETQIYRNRPEMKTATTISSPTVAAGQQHLNQVCRVAQGTNGSERLGDRIRVWRIEVRGATSPRLDHYIIQQKTSIAPSIGIFNNAQGAYINDQDNTNRFTEWAHHRNTSVDASKVCGFKFSKRFKGGVVVKFNGPAGTDIVDNELCFVAVNRSGVANDMSYAVRVWYTDA